MPHVNPNPAFEPDVEPAPAGSMEEFDAWKASNSQALAALADRAAQS